MFREDADDLCCVQPFILAVVLQTETKNFSPGLEAAAMMNGNLMS